ncbi:MAG: hypothetical protein A2275_06925 [Bacteroidetes bacterium RIFOXYA12_FULL_35_11]|nr:MAG: hypothetical protein A2X01_01240 [Bacteroidetes bacterium GWF2_35_48]OFY83167.1 MAG: hypothetical protein A2275_06925 [Bacteroidetes bacterium RIFOXYA12_FULL_35_11]OFY97343.1 MAG: hypothetical protein A2491_21160 [Bacteroidetes bacterium RIFOXYC12_FULL_35_7]HBX51201.1 hypothetical protein [Bacteroidales bacterium]
MKTKFFILSVSALALITSIANAQLINPGFETWTNDILVPAAMNPNSGNDTYGWCDYNFFNSPLAGNSPITVTRCTDTVRTGNYSVRLESKVYTPTSWNIYKYWGIPFIGHEYNDTLGILFNGKLNVTNQTFIPGTACPQNLAQFKFYYQYRPNGNDTAECRVALMSGDSLVAGGAFKTSTATAGSGWQEAVIDFTYISGLTPDTLYVLFSSTSLDYSPRSGSVLWIDDASFVFPTGVEQILEEESNVTIFPNPSNGAFSIRNLQGNNNQQIIEIYNLLGEKVYYAFYKDKSMLDVDISSSSRGIYFVKFFDEGKINIERIVIQ